MAYSEDTPVLEVKNLAVGYETRFGMVEAVRDVSFEIRRCETFGLVGESGCGKSTTAFAIVNFLGRNGHIVAGDVIFEGGSLVDRSEQELRKLRGNRISMVYQDPMQALNPSLEIGDQVGEVLIAHQKMNKSEAADRTLAMLKRVYMPDAEKIMKRYPHQLSGGQQQRAVIAMALLNHPSLLIMDEPTTALDVTVEAAVLDLIDDLRHEFDSAILYISHNLGVVARVSDRVGVMYAGELVEKATVEDIFVEPMHPYTKGLLRCIPTLTSGKSKEALEPIRGRVPSPSELPPGCLFEPRCDFAREECRIAHPQLVEKEAEHLSRCPYVSGPPAETVAPTGGYVQDAPVGTDGESLLHVSNLKTYYESEDRSVLGMLGLRPKAYVRAVDDVTFELPKGVTLGIVGESGCGKSTLAKTIIGLEAPAGGEISFRGIDIATPVGQRSFENIREIQMVFQNPDSTLNPFFSVGYQISRPLHRFTKLSRKEIKDEALRLLDAVNLDARYYDRMPRQLSGGEKQRVAIARAIAARPEMIICDEPVSSLDVSVQASTLNLLLSLQKEFGITIIFISHDLSVVRFFSDYVAVMYLGRVCEIGPSHSIYEPPYHPYTEALLSAVCIPDPRIKQKRMHLKGSVPSALNPPEGCRFNTRCPRSQAGLCDIVEPGAQDLGDGHFIYCNRSTEELRAFKTIIKFVDAPSN